MSNTVMIVLLTALGALLLAAASATSSYDRVLLANLESFLGYAALIGAACLALGFGGGSGKAAKASAKGDSHSHG